MATSRTKSIRVRARSDLREEFGRRGWKMASVGYKVEVPPLGYLSLPLEMIWAPDVTPSKYGGISVWGYGRIESRDVSNFMTSLPGGCLDTVSERGLKDGRTSVTLAWTDFGELGVGDGWQGIDEDGLAAATDRYLAIVDGPLREWIDHRKTASLLLALQAGPGSADAQNAALVRSMSILALQTNEVASARRLLAGFVPNGRNDTEERVAWFERELAERLPQYGSLQRREVGQQA